MEPASTRMWAANRLLPTGSGICIEGLRLSIEIVPRVAHCALEEILFLGGWGEMCLPLWVATDNRAFKKNVNHEFFRYYLEAVGEKYTHS